MIKFIKFLHAVKRNTELKILALVWVLVLVSANVPGIVEGKHMPVINNFSAEIVAYSDQSSDIYLNYDKVRNCSFRKIEFYIGDTEGELRQSAALQAVYHGPELVRWAGTHRAGPYRVNAPVAALDDVTVRVFHRCHIGYQTVTRYRIVDGKAERLG